MSPHWQDSEAPDAWWRRMKAYDSDAADCWATMVSTIHQGTMGYCHAKGTDRLGLCPKHAAAICGPNEDHVQTQ